MSQARKKGGSKGPTTLVKPLEREPFSPWEVGVLARRCLEALVLGALFTLTFRLQTGGAFAWVGVLLGFLFPFLLLEAALRQRRLGWLGLAFFLGQVGVFYWVPATLASKGPMPFPAALAAASAFWAWEALGFLGVTFLTRWSFRRGGPWLAALAAALGILVWELWGFHVYPWNWGTALSGLSWTGRSAAFLLAPGLSAWTWGCATLGAAFLVRGAHARSLQVAGTWLALPLALSAAWFLLPRSPERRLDVVLIQPNFVSGLRRPGMEAEMWDRSDRALKEAGLPRPDPKAPPILLLWPESSVLGEDHRHDDPRLQGEAQRRRVAWLFGTEGGLFNLVRGEVAGRPSFIQAKTEPMAFGERMPGPEPLRRWLDQRMGLLSQEAGTLGPDSVFRVPTPNGPDLRIHPLICSEALDPLRVLRGRALTSSSFDRSPATDLHALQIRARAVEQGIPLLRSTLTGKSGLFRADGSGGLWGEALSEGHWSLSLAWRPVATPARWVGLPWLWLGLLAGAWLILFARRSR